MTKVADERLGEFARFQHDLFERVQKGSLDPEKVTALVSPLIGINPIFRPLSDKNTLVIPACTGGKTIAKAKDIFKSGIDSAFNSESLSKSPTPESKAHVLAISRQMPVLESVFYLSKCFLDLSFSQEQIITFCEKYPSFVKREYPWQSISFLTTNEYEIILIGVRTYASGLRITKDNIWNHSFCEGCRLVVRVPE